MKILLTAINAKFIHSNPAIYSLRAFAGEEFREYIELAEYTINNKMEEILADIYSRKPDVIAFSCYIWNRELVTKLVTELPKVLPEVDIWLGGPEASYDAENLLKKHQSLTGVMIGEGEETFWELAKYYCTDASLVEIQGIAYRASTSAENKICVTPSGKSAEDKICVTPSRQPTDMSKLPFLYEDLN